MAAARIGVRELKTRLGTYLGRVRGGETIIVTDHGEPTAEIRPIPGRRLSIADRLGQLQAAGRITLPAGTRPRAFRPVDTMGARLSRAVLDDREDRC